MAYPLPCLLIQSEGVLHNPQYGCLGFITDPFEIVDSIYALRVGFPDSV
jgi:hypothetical protein